MTLPLLDPHCARCALRFDEAADASQELCSFRNAAAAHGERVEPEEATQLLAEVRDRIEELVTHLHNEEHVCGCGAPLPDERHERLPGLCGECLREVAEDERADRRMEDRWIANYLRSAR